MKQATSTPKHIHIDRLVVDDNVCKPSDAPALQKAVETELSRLIAGQQSSRGGKSKMEVMAARIAAELHRGLVQK